MGDQPDRRRKPFRSWFLSWSTSRASQRPHRQPQPPPPSNTSQFAKLQERSTWRATAEGQSSHAQSPPIPPVQSPPPETLHAEQRRATEDSQELAIGSETVVGDPEAQSIISFQPNEEKNAIPYKFIDLEALRNFEIENPIVESLEGEAIMTRENLQVENVSTEICERKTKLEPDSKQAETNNVEQPVFEAVAEVAGEIGLGPGTETQVQCNEAPVEQSVEEETEKDRSPDKSAITEKIAIELDEAADGKPDNQVNQDQRKKTEPKLPITELASKGNNYHARKEKIKSDTLGEPINSSFKESKKHISTVERNITISPMPHVASLNLEQHSMQKELKESLPKLVQKLSGHQNKPGDEQGVSIITLASKNKGAIMLIGREGFRGEATINTNKGNIIGKGTTREGHCHNARNTNASITTSINSNVQGVNSSILNETKFSARKPGVHMTISTKPTTIWCNKGKTESVTSQKAASLIARPQKLTFEPSSRRRCLRGLLVEPSEDDMENSEKPRRHGCRFTCDIEKKENGEGSGS